jgi:hypothetical protein
MREVMASDRIFPGAQKWARTKIQQREAERYPPLPRREKQTTMAMNMEIEKETKEKMKKKILNETKCAAEEREQIEMVVVVMMMMMMIVGAIQKKR